MNDSISVVQIEGMSLSGVEMLSIGQSNRLISLYISDRAGVMVKPNIMSNISLGEKLCTIATNYFKSMAESKNFSGSFVSFS